MSRRLLLILGVALLLVFDVLADRESLDVATCSGATSCSVTGLNSDDTLWDGATIGKNGVLTTTWTDTTFASGSTIDNVTFTITRGGDAGISSTLDIVMRNGADTITYCTFFINNLEADTKETLETFGNCSWTQGRLDDLTITILNNDDSSPDNAYLSFLNLNITFTPPDTTLPTVSLNTPDNNTWDLDGSVIFTYTPSDDRGVANCSLYLDGVLNQTNTSPVNGSQNSFVVTGLSDGNHTWLVNCSDTSNNTNASPTRRVKIDTKPPQVNLELPPNNNVSSETKVTFYYNASDAQTTLASCELIMNDTVKDTTSTPAEETSLNFTITIANGDYTWWVNCTDANGFENASLQRNITINASTPSLITNYPSYQLGETVQVSGESWNSLVELTFNYTLPNGTVISKTNTTTEGGTVSNYLFLDYSYQNGTYQLYAYQTSDPSENASRSFKVSLPPTTLLISPDSYPQGDEVFINGTGYSPSSTLNVTITFSDASTDSFTVPTDAEGSFATSRNLSYTAPLGLANVSGVDLTYPKLNATSNFTVTGRSAMVITDNATYGREENVNVYGYNFTRQGVVEVAIYDNSTDDIGTSFPVYKNADDNGYFTHGWDTGDTCNGVYRVEAIDQNNSFLNDTTYFTIEELIQNENISLVVAGAKYDTARAPITVSNVQDSDDSDETLSSNAGNTWYFELNFTNYYNRGLTIDSVIFLVEHAETAGLTNPSLTYWNGSAYVGVSCPGFTTSTTDHEDTCDITSLFEKPSDLDSVSLRFSLSKSGGGPQTATIDYASLNITTSYEPTCTYFNGSSGGGLGTNPPYISSVLLEDGVGTPPNELDLTAGTTSTINCNVTVFDDDGYGDIDSVSATLYSRTVSASSPDDNTNHYTTPSCTFNTGSGNVANYTCVFLVWYYAVNGTWTCEATATDGTDTSTGEDSSTMNQLYALNITPVLLDYGDISEGEISSEFMVNVTNIGNTVLNVSVRGYGKVSGDGLSFICQQENITIGAERYGAVSSSYSAKTPLTTDFTHMGITIPSTQDGTPSRKESYWQLQVPTSGEPRGRCNGTIVFQAEA